MSSRRSVTRAATSPRPPRSRPVYPDTVAGVQLNRFCASGLEAVNQAASRVRGGFEDLILAGGVESMSRVAMGSDGGAWASDPATAFATAFVPQGIGADLIATIEGFSREDVDTFAVESNHRAAKAWADGRFAGSIVPVKDVNGVTVLDHDEFIKPESSVEGLARLKPSFAGIGDQAGFDSVALEKYHWIEKIDHVHHAGNSSGIVDGAALDGHRQRAGRQGPRPDPAGADHRHRGLRRRPDDHADRSRARPAARRWPRPASRSRTSTCSRSTRPSRPWRCGS